MIEARERGSEMGRVAEWGCLRREEERKSRKEVGEEKEGGR